MAKVQVTFDTVTKELEYTVDGEKIEADFCHFYRYCEGDKWMMEVGRGSEEQDGMRVHTRVTASEKDTLYNDISNLMRIKPTK